MAKYLTLFDTHSSYEEYINGPDAILPNVSYCKDNAETYFKPYVHDYSKDYLTTIARESGTISFNIWKNMGTNFITSINYSTDGGETWVTTQNQDNKEENLVISVNVSEGDKVLWKGDALKTAYYDDEYETYLGSFFSSTAEFDAEGNVMSLLYGDDFFDKTELEYPGQFACLFFDSNEENGCLIVSAENLVLPATTLASYCYYSMFAGCTSITTAPSILPATTLSEDCYGHMFDSCTSLVQAPELPATTLSDSCYDSMFQACTSLIAAPSSIGTSATTMATSACMSMFNGCTSLTTAPELPATTLAGSCYYDMFDSCTSLVQAPELPATTLAQGCYASMFNGCTSLTTAPELPATTLASSCYEQMFSNCTSLTSTPELPATTLAARCYSGMFYGCTGLTTAPELPATTLTQNCYGSMFYGCTSLTTAPDLPATTLSEYCYFGMFNGCTKLNYLKCLATNISASFCTTQWLLGVSSTGTFVKNPNMSSWTTGVEGIPANWAVQDAS